MEAKPIIDIAIGFENLSNEDIDNIIPKLEKLDFVYRGNEGEEGGYLFIKQKTEDVTTHHIHIVTKDDQQWRNYILFRDALRKNPKIAKTYKLLKRDLAKQYPENRLMYTDGKHDFIKLTIKEFG